MIAGSVKEYEGNFEFDSKKILAAMRRYKDSPKKPTSVALDETTIQELKAVAEKQGIPYQVLIRVFILDGLSSVLYRNISPSLLKYRFFSSILELTDCLIYETLMIQILKAGSREFKEFPDEVKEDLADALARLDEVHNLSMPLSCPMPSIGAGVHELRFRDRKGLYRVIYFIKRSGDIWLLHAFKKKTQATPQQNIELAKQRLKGV